MSTRRLQVSFDLPAEAAGLVQAAAIQLGGTITSIELVEVIETYSKNLRLKGPKKLHPILTLIEEQFQHSSEINIAVVKALAARKHIEAGTVQFYFKRELLAERLQRVKPGIYRRP